MSSSIVSMTDNFLDELDLTDLSNSCQIFEDICDCPETLEKAIPEKHSLDRWDDDNFFLLFRLRKDTVQQLFGMLRPAIAYQLRNHKKHVLTYDCREVMTAILMTLRFFATGTIDADVDLDTAFRYFSGVSRTVACLYVRTVSHALFSVRDMYISMPSLSSEVATTHQLFSEVAGFPKVLGVIGGTHIRLNICDEKDSIEKRSYRWRCNANGKSIYSKNVQIVAGPSLEIMKVTAKCPGTTPRSTIFYTSQLRNSLEAKHWGDTYVLGSNDYVCSHYILTSLVRPKTPAEKLYNESLNQTKKIVDNLIAAWKQRFPILSRGFNTTLQILRLKRVDMYIVSCAVLHNIALLNKEDLPPVDRTVILPKDDHQSRNYIGAEGAGPDNFSGTAVRDNLINKYFAAKIVQN